MAAREGIFVRPGADGAWEYGTYTLGDKSKDKVLGIAATREAAHGALIARLRADLRKNDRLMWLCIAAAAALLIWPML